MVLSVKSARSRPARDVLSVRVSGIVPENVKWKTGKTIKLRAITLLSRQSQIRLKRNNR